MSVFKKIYILDDYASSERNGVGSFLSELLFCLKDENLSVIHFNSNYNEFYIIKKKIEYIYFPKFPRRAYPQYYKIISYFFRKYIKDSEGNIFIMNHGPCKDLMLSLKQYFPLSKILFICHDMEWTSKMQGYAIKFKSIINNINYNKNLPIIERYKERLSMYEIADKIVCLNEDTRTLLIENYNLKSSKLCLIRNGMRDIIKKINTSDKETIRRKLGLEDYFIILFVGRTVENKGFFVLLQAFKEVLISNPKAKLVIAGTIINSEGIWEKLEGIRANVIFTGHIGKKELYEWYITSDMGVIPSFIEQCSYVGIEMTMFGLPIVASDAWGVKNMFDNSNAIIAKIGDRSKEQEYILNLSDAILKCISANKTRLIKLSRKNYLSKYNIKYMKRNYIDIIVSIRGLSPLHNAEY